MKKHYIQEFARGHYHVISPDGIPVYDNEPYGKDKPIVFDDEDLALDFANKCNDDMMEENN